MHRCRRSVCLGILLLGGCTPRLCDEQLSASGQYTVRILDFERDGGQFKYEPGWINAFSEPTASCAGFDGMVVDSSVQLRALGTVDDAVKTCRRIEASVVSLPSPTVLVADNPHPSAGLSARGDLYGSADVTINDCPGEMSLQIFGASAKGPYSKPVPGEAPPAVLYRLFVPSTACLQRCEDNFAVQLTLN
jgi:hypothetical protein